MGKKMNLYLIFAFCLLAVLVLNFMSAQAENSYYEEIDLCESDDENLREKCEDNRATWEMYGMAWKVAGVIALTCLVAAFILPGNSLEG